jgi:hypothetical protein
MVWPIKKRWKNNITQDHYFRIDIFYAAIDAIITELDHRFNERSLELLVFFLVLIQEIHSPSLMLLSLFGLRISIIMISLLMTAKE